MANGQNAAIFGQIANVVMGAINSRGMATDRGTVTSPAGTTTKEEVVDALANNPVVVNQLNAEEPVQSRVAWGSVIATAGSTIAGVTAMGSAMGWLTPDEGAAITGGVTGLVGAAGALYALYGRFATGLKPLFSRK